LFKLRQLLDEREGVVAHVAVRSFKVRHINKAGTEGQGAVHNVGAGQTSNSLTSEPKVSREVILHTKFRNT
jgi:hypothetical protein